MLPNYQLSTVTCQLSIPKMYKYKVGELRPSQILFSFGVGAVLDLPNLSVMVMGLEDWNTQNSIELNEPRLLAAVRKELGSQVKKLLSPPTPPENITSSSPFDEVNRIGIPVAPFPSWMVCPKCHLLAPLKSELFQLKDNPYRPDQTKYVHKNCPKSKVDLSRKNPQWVPASEVKGEGIFMQFNEEKLSQWEQNQLLQDYQNRAFEAHKQWCKIRSLDPVKITFPGVRYILLHSFAHALMRQMAIECGYNAASLKERIYSKRPQEEGGPMAGILIYTAAPDSEGTLGGLVSLGEPKKLGYHIDQALEQMQLCTSDPLCAEHTPFQGTTSLHWAACHACLFSPETSCERGNKYLDRAVLVPTVIGGDLAFFPEVK